MRAYRELFRKDLFPVRYFITSHKMQQVHPHWHSEIELLLVLEGNAVQQMDDQIFTIDKDDIVILWSNQFHSTYSETECSILVLQFNLSDFMLFSNKGRNIKFHDKIDKTSDPGMIIKKSIQKIASEMEGKREAYEFVVSAEICALCAEILRNLSILPVDRAGSEVAPETAAKLIDYIETNYENSITLKEAASWAHLSVSHFSRICKGVTGMSFKQYLNFYRINRAACMLENGYNVTESALRCGFSDINTFIRNFKRIKKCTPSAYIKGV